MVEPVDKKTRLEVLFAKWRKLTSKERNAELEILFGAILAKTAEDGEIKPADLELLRTVQKCFNISIRWEELNKGGDVGY